MEEIYLLNPGKKGQPIAVKSHDFVDKNLGKVALYGVYDIGRTRAGLKIQAMLDNNLYQQRIKIAKRRVEL